MHVKECWILEIEQIGYHEAHELQKKLVNARLKNQIKDILLLLEHSPVFTASRKETFNHILADQSALEKEGIQVCQTDRGGDVTYHGPGQVVGYSIMDLKAQGKDLHRYIRNIEQMLIDTLMEYGIRAENKPQYPGVWVGEEKIAAIGIAIKKGWISMHGFALNVEPNMKHYEMIIPCGIADKGVTSMAAILGTSVDVVELNKRISDHYGTIFQRLPKRMTMEALPWF
jgi:lipoate-protein ligase B